MAFDRLRGFLRKIAPFTGPAGIAATTSPEEAYERRANREDERNNSPWKGVEVTGSPLIPPLGSGGAINQLPTKGFGAQSMQFLNKQMDRLNIPEDQREAFSKNMYDWSQQVRNVESDNNPMAAAGTTSAKGVYQFTDDSVNTGINRMKNLGFEDDFTQGISSNPQEWSDEQADSMFLGNMFAQTGSDDFMRQIGGGDEKARQDAYYKFHHTDPDEATKTRVEKLMPYSNQPVDDTMANYNKVNDAFSY